MKRLAFGKLALAATLALACVAPARAEFQLLDDGTGTKQVCHDGNAVYALKDNGSIFMFSGGRWQQIDNATDSSTKQIAAEQGRVYALKNDGRLFRLAFGQWLMIGRNNSRQIAVGGTDVYTLESNEDVYMFWHGDGQWRKVDNGTRTTMIAADERRGLFVLKNSGQIFHHLGNAQFEMFDDGTGTKQIAASAGVTYALKDNGNIWRNNGAWAMIDDGNNTLQMAPDGMNLAILKGDRSVFVRRNEQWNRANTPPDIKQLAARADEVVALRESGNILIARNGSFASDIRVQRFQQLYNDAK